MSRSPSAIIRNAPKVCSDATNVADALRREGRKCDADTIMRLVSWHAKAAKQVEKLRGD